MMATLEQQDVSRRVERAVSELACAMRDATRLGVPLYVSRMLVDAMQVPHEPSVVAEPVDPAAQVVCIDYTNWRGERAARRIRPIRFYYDVSQWHPEPQWLLLAFDEDKQENRTFAMQGVHGWCQEELNAAVSV